MLWTNIFLKIPVCILLPCTTQIIIINENAGLQSDSIDIFPSPIMIWILCRREVAGQTGA
jgi:hypothetical protein